MSYMITRWALIRRGELSVTPDTIEIHSDFLQTLSREDFETAFRQIGDLFYQIMTDISENPERFAMPLHDEESARYGAPQAHESRYAAWRPANLLYTIFTHGRLTDRGFQIDIPAFKQANKIKHVHLLFKALGDYGFIVSGLTGGKITPKTVEIMVDYPDNPNIITVISAVAQKAAGVDAQDMFCRWSFRLLSEEFGKNSCQDPFYAVFDKTRTDAEREFLCKFHEIMQRLGYYHADGSWNEGPGICYYDKESVMRRKGPYQFRVLDWMGDLRLMIRIRNAEVCFDLYPEQNMPGEIIEMFRHSDPGCGAHADGTCKKGVGYRFDGQTRWHCGCCNAPFWLRPKTENIDHYITLVKAGEKRSAG